MGLFSFVKDIGKNIFHSSKNEQPATQAPTQATPDQSHMMEQYLRGMGLSVNNLGVRYDGQGKVTLTGEVPSQADYEKLTLMAGNLAGVSQVDNQMSVANAQPQEPKTYTVKSGDNLSKIAKEVYGDANKYPLIFEANKPMLKDPDEIFPGQVLRLPQA